MTPQLARIAFFGLIVWLIVRDIKKRPDASAATWLVVIWAVIFGSRPVSQWFQSDVVNMTAEAYLEGSPIDRTAYLILILLAFAVLLKRSVTFGAIIRQNRWLFAFYGYCLLSVLWADYPFVSFKRLFKDFGCVVMVMLLYTERDPVESIKAVFVRCAYLLIPLSVLWVKYFPELGRTYTGFHRDTLMYVGVASHKNTLGQMLLVSGVILLWDLLGRKTEAQAGKKRAWVDGALVLGMGVWLLVIANSVTSLLCTAIGATILVVTRLKTFPRKARLVETYAIAALALWWVSDALFNIDEFVVTDILGRNMTLTSRTPMWEIVLGEVVHPLFGAGFLSFWTGERLERLWISLEGIIQAHSGYIETYLDLGLVGLAFLGAALFAGFRKIKKGLIAGDDFARVRLAFWVIALFYNYSEASFNSLSLLWLVTLLVIAESPTSRPLLPTPPVLQKKWAPGRSTWAPSPRPAPAFHSPTSSRTL